MTDKFINLSPAIEFSNDKLVVSIARFKEFLEKNKDTAFIGHDCSKCPLYEFFKKNGHSGYVGIESIYFENFFNRSYALPLWASKFSSNVEKIGKITGEESLQVLNRIMRNLESEKI